LSGARRVFEILDTEPLLEEPKNPVVLDHNAKSVEFVDVSFGYTAEKRVLEGVSLQVNPGEYVAIVGEMGAGKTALLNLIPRFYDAFSGSVRIGNRDVREYDLSALRRHVRMVFQESFIFSASVAEEYFLWMPRGFFGNDCGGCENRQRA